MLGLDTLQKNAKKYLNYINIFKRLWNFGHKYAIKHGIDILNIGIVYRHLVFYKKPKYTLKASPSIIMYYCLSFSNTYFYRSGSKPYIILYNYIKAL